MVRDWAPHYADIYMAKFEKEALYKAALKSHTYYRYLDDIFISWKQPYLKIQKMKMD